MVSFGLKRRFFFSSSSLSVKQAVRTHDLPHPHKHLITRLIVFIIGNCDPYHWALHSLSTVTYDHRMTYLPPMIILITLLTQYALRSYVISLRKL